MSEAPATSIPSKGLVVRGLKKSYGRRAILTHIDFDVQRGEVVAILGPNGAGKTSSFYIVCGLLRADGGQVLLDGQDITRLPMYQRARLGVGYLPQDASIFQGLSAEDNIRAILQLNGKTRTQQRDRLEGLLDEFNLQKVRTALAPALSGGERRRVEIARALASDPEFILLDEPFAGVDPLAVADIRTLVSKLKTYGIGILITDHNVREALEVVDRAFIIYDGTILKAGTPHEIVRDPAVQQHYLGDSMRRSVHLSDDAGR